MGPTDRPHALGARPPRLTPPPRPSARQAAAAAPAAAPAAAGPKRVLVFEAPGGKDKGIDGYRRDTAALVEALKAKGLAAEVVFYSEATREKLESGVPGAFAGCAQRAQWREPVARSQRQR